MLIFETVNMVELGDFDALVEETYNRPYSFQQQDGCKPRGIASFTVPDEEPWDYENDTIPEEINGEEMGVSFKAWLARDPKEWNGEEDPGYYIQMFWERNFYPTLESVAQDLHKKGLIPAGKYTINIDW